MRILQFVLSRGWRRISGRVWMNSCDESGRRKLKLIDICIFLFFSVQLSHLVHSAAATHATKQRTVALAFVHIYLRTNKNPSIQRRATVRVREIVTDMSGFDVAKPRIRIPISQAPRDNRETWKTNWKPWPTWRIRDARFASIYRLKPVKNRDRYISRRSRIWWGVFRCSVWNAEFISRRLALIIHSCESWIIYFSFLLFSSDAGFNRREKYGWLTWERHNRFVATCTE